MTSSDDLSVPASQKQVAMVSDFSAIFSQNVISKCSLQLPSLSDNSADDDDDDDDEHGDQPTSIPVDERDQPDEPPCDKRARMNEETGVETAASTTIDMSIDSVTPAERCDASHTDTDNFDEQVSIEDEFGDMVSYLP